jgi:rare lipoprotein A
MRASPSALILVLVLCIAPQAAKAQAAATKAVETGTASWYGPDFNGKRTSSGEIYDKEKLTAAHRTLPFGTYLRVLDLDNGSSVVVRVNDRGPFAKNRVIDLSEAAARIIGMIPSGTARVSLTAIPKEEALAWKGGGIDGAPAIDASPDAGARASPDAGARASPDARVRIQVASYANEANAMATVQRLEMSGLAAMIERSPSRFRVVFPDLSQAEARIVTLKLDGLGYREYTVTIIRPAAKP